LDLSPLLSILLDTDAFRRLQKAVSSRLEKPVSLALLRAARPPILAALAREPAGPIVLLTAHAEHALAFRDEIRAWNPALEPLIFSEPAPLFYETSPWGPRTVRERITCLARLAEYSLSGGRLPQPLIVIAPSRALITPTIPPREFLSATRFLSPGMTAPPEKLARDLVALGYRMESLVVEPGQAGRRGGILDVWPPAENVPTRIEFFGDAIDTLRPFEPATQRTHAKTDRLRITPARELLPRDLAGASHLPAIPDLPEGSLSEFHLPWVYSPAGLLDHLPSYGIIVLDDSNELRDSIADLEDHALRLREEAVASGILPADSPPAHLTWDDVRESLETRSVLYLDSGDEECERIPLGEEFSPPQRFGGQLKSFVEQVHHSRQEGARTVVVSRQADRLLEVWNEQRPDTGSIAPPVEALAAPPAESDLVFVHGTLQEGFVSRHLHLLTDIDIFGWSRPEPRRRPAPKALGPEAAYADLRPGDYVVHIEFGIGQFAGLVGRTVDGLEREFLQVEFGDGGQVYVPIHQVDRLTRYIGADERPPALSRLGSPEWTAARDKARRAAVEVARDLLNLYARRETAPGQAFSPDTVWQREMESSFAYTETEDQLRAIDEVKRDMERPRPMDRLICGDVGYGKTEVALRAAFKAVMDGVQVAVLVPTTVLAQQHYQTFSQRLAAYPVRVEMLSRFRTPAEQGQILARLAAGEVDILIGTHRLLQQDVKFSRLALLIIDEEQRFGVAHKEFLKKLRTEVDVLTLTATPIPRTLYLSLSGVRDISMINTPPEERMSIVTRVGQYNEKTVRQAILREIERGGQVFYLHNRVESIRVVAQKLTALVPEARIRVAHGQMPEHELEQTMDLFVRGEVDVLLCTSIIESGLDIPNSNTLIVDRADTFGLAQLYQLRGRVGRGPVRAYAYFFTDRRHRPTPEAYERLQTLAEQTELGAGYAIAMRDLEIRGAGEILGTRQSGHIAAIGFHLYTRLLSQAVRRLRAEREGRVPEAEGLPPTVDLPLPAALPEEYVPDRGLRLRLYRRMAEMHTEEDLGALRQEFEDRFGPIPHAVENLLYQLQVKILAWKAGVDSVVMASGVLVLSIPLPEDVHMAEVQPGARYSKGRVYLPAKMPPEEWKPMLVEALDWLGKKGRLSPEINNRQGRSGISGSSKKI
jgi:transcription-repair coupling factor (superfamily II helicase)